MVIQYGKAVSLNNLYHRAWDWVILLCTLYVVLESPLRAVFDYSISTPWLYVEVLISLFFTANIANYFWASYGVQKETHLPKTASHYFRFWFWIDVLSAFPLDLIFASGEGSPLVLLRLLRLLRFLRLVTLMRDLLGPRWVFQPVLTRILLLIFWVFLAAHFIACVWISLGGLIEEVEPSRRYLRSIYWAITTLSTIGYGDITPITNNQILYVILVEIIGVGMYAYLIGNVASLLSNLDMARSHFKENMEQVNAYLRHRNIPTLIQDKVQDYYEYLWSRRIGHRGSRIIERLPLTLQSEITWYLNKAIIEKVPIFQNTSEAFTREISNVLRLVIFIPKSTIIYSGEIGDCMYLISKGTVQIISKGKSFMPDTLTEGDFFGEATLVNKEPFMATVRTKDYCELYILDRDNFKRVLMKFPEMAKHVYQSMWEHRRKVIRNTARTRKNSSQKRSKK